MLSHLESARHAGTSELWENSLTGSRERRSTTGMNNLFLRKLNKADTMIMNDDKRQQMIRSWLRRSLAKGCPDRVVLGNTRRAIGCCRPTTSSQPITFLRIPSPKVSNLADRRLGGSSIQSIKTSLSNLQPCASFPIIPLLYPDFSTTSKPQTTTTSRSEPRSP